MPRPHHDAGTGADREPRPECPGDQEWLARTDRGSSCRRPQADTIAFAIAELGEEAHALGQRGAPDQRIAAVSLGAIEHRFEVGRAEIDDAAVYGRLAVLELDQGAAGVRFRATRKNGDVGATEVLALQRLREDGFVEA